MGFALAEDVTTRLKKFLAWHDPIRYGYGS
jgi:hypothetical protein